MNLVSCMGCSHCRRPVPPSKLSSRQSNMEISPSFSGWLGRVERTWSGNLAERAAAGEKVTRKSSSKLRSVQDGAPHAGSAVVAVDCITTPRLARCYKVKRDWSFVDPRKAVAIVGFHKFRIF